MQDAKTVKTYQELSAVLTYVETVHRRVSSACAAFGERTAADQHRDLMMSFASVESDWEESLRAVACDRPTELLKTWIQFVPTHVLDVLLDRIESIDELAWYDVAALALQIQDGIVSLLERVREQTTATPVCEFLLDLANAERELGKTLSKKLLSLQEM